jgi:hypothetical protein
MTKLKILSAVVILSAAIATPVFAQSTHQSRAHVRHFRGAYNQMIEPNSIQPTQSGWNNENYQFNHSFPGGADPDRNPGH